MNEPKVIYLNVGFDKDEVDIKDEDFEKLIGISWSDCKINDQDLRYELSERQTPTEANKNADTKQLIIADVRLSLPDIEAVSEPIQNALYATRNFTTDQCSTLTDGILLYLKDAGFEIIKGNEA